jgi:hypothetical protein
MANDNLFRLSIWRPARLERPLSFFATAKGQPIIFEPDLLQEQIYVWDPGQEDVFLWLDEITVNLFRNVLMEQFAPQLPPSHRNLAQFSKALANLTTKLQKGSHSNWVDSQQGVELGVNETANLRVNTVLSLLQHLYWIFRTFEHMPGASVVIR